MGCGLWKREDKDELRATSQRRWRDNSPLAELGCSAGQQLGGGVGEDPEFRNVESRV